VGVEHEAKFRLDDCLEIETRLERLGRLRTPWHFESNTVYDRDGELAAWGRLLRLRRALTSTLTFKEPLPGPKTGGVKSRVEHETRVEDPAAMDAILCGLGYAPQLCYEKFRAVWELPRGLVCLDILPFGHFLEIEASPEDIPGLAMALGLRPAEAMDKSYHDLHQSWRRQNGLDASRNFVFGEDVRRHLFTRLGCQAHIQGAPHAD
jgi:adenylate cyclase class 2